MPQPAIKTSKHHQALTEPSITYGETYLVNMLQERVGKGFEYLYNNYSAALFAAILEMVPDRHIAAEILQDVFVNIYRNIGSYNAQKGRLYTWMLTIARNLCIDTCRKKTYRNNLKNDDIVDFADTMQLCTWQQADDMGIKKLLGRLKPKHRETIELCYLQGYTQLEISQMLAVPLGTVKTRIAAGILQLRALLAVCG